MAESRVKNTEAPMKFDFPEEDKIVCKDCAFREKDRLGGKVKGAELGICEVYATKPMEILFDGEKCPYYTKE